MTERGLPPMDGSPACPFVAFDDDRDARADRPDHRHRCFAEAEPAPRALAHQEAYCLSSAFPVCPTFQAWARREAAHARSAPMPPPATVAEASPTTSDAPASADEWSVPGTPRLDTGEDVPVESTPRRNPPRDWAAPPPWATGAQAGGASGAASSSGAGSRPASAEMSSEAPGFLAPRSEGQGLAGSAADRLASGEPIAPASGTSSRGGGAAPGAGPGPSVAPRPSDLPSAAPDPELAGLVGGASASAAATGAGVGQHGGDMDPAGYPPPTRSGKRPTVGSTRTAARSRDASRPPTREHVQHDGPSWEQARRYEAYPAIRSRPSLSGLPGLPRVAVLAGALGIAALALFFLPALLGVGGDDSPSATPTASLAPATPTPSPTPEPDPTPQTYTIQEGDTLSAVAREFGLTLDQLLEANKETIENPDRISVGDVIIIPVPVPEEVGGASAEPTPEP